MYHRIHYRSNHLVLGVALMLLILGAGNLLFGTVKAAEYRSLSQVQLSRDSPRDSETNGEMPATVVIQESGALSPEYLSYLRARLDFYRFVVVGGKWMLALSGFLLLVFLALRGGSSDEVTK